MRRESLAFALSGVLFGLLVGWMLGSQQASPPAAMSSAAPAAAQSSATPPPFDAQRAASLEQQANAQPADAAVRAALGNLYFDAERYDVATKWYEASAKIDPLNVDVSTDLGVSYYYTDQVDKALAQFDRSLKLDPRHLKTLLNQGVVRAFGKRDLDGAAESWGKIVAIAPDSDEGRRAKQGLEGLKSAHQAAAGSAPPGGKD